MNIQRELFLAIEEKIKTSSKVVLLYGARQVGKTTLIKKILNTSFSEYKTLSLTGEDRRYLDILSSLEVSKLESLVSGYDLLFIDEAQKVPNIGITLKLLHDHFPLLKVVVTGSSSFELKNQLQEPLTGRVWTFSMYPISTKELSLSSNTFELQEGFSERMIFGSYPEVFQYKNFQEKKEYLQTLSSSYLYKDIFEITNIKYPEKIRKLLQLLSFQITSEFSLSELSKKLEITKETVAHYIDLLEKSFVIFRLSGFSRNLRKEITKMDKIYFWDNGVRNAIINNFFPLDERNDMGALWENFLVSERLKKNAYEKNAYHSYFWRLHTGAEIDYIEEQDAGKLLGVEIKSRKKNVKPPKSFLENYPDSVFTTVYPENAVEFLV